MSSWRKCSSSLDPTMTTSLGSLYTYTYTPNRPTTRGLHQLTYATSDLSVAYDDGFDIRVSCLCLRSLIEGTNRRADDIDRMPCLTTLLTPLGIFLSSLCLSANRVRCNSILSVALTTKQPEDQIRYSGNRLSCSTSNLSTHTSLTTFLAYYCISDIMYVQY